MISYIVSTVDKYNSGSFVGQQVLDSAWSSDIRSEADSVEEAIKKETEWLADAIEDGSSFSSLDGVDADSGLVWWTNTTGDEIVTEVSIDLVENEEAKK